MRHPAYLHQSRHGVYYFRARTPLYLRQRHPELPAETKASLGSKNRRFACTVGHLVFRQWVDWLASLEQQDLPTMDVNFSSWTTYRHPFFGRVVQTTADDTPATLAKMLEYLHSLDAQRATDDDAATTGALPAPAPRPTEPPPLIAPASRPTVTGEPELEPASRRMAPANVLPPRHDPTAGFTAHHGLAAEWLSDVIEKWHRHKVNTGAWKVPSTWTNAYEPDLRVFRELVAHDRRIAAAGGAPMWDLRIGDLDETRVGQFVECFWRYPAQQGKRPAAGDAKTALTLNPASNAAFIARRRKSGGPVNWSSPQRLSRANPSMPSISAAFPVSAQISPPESTNRPLVCVYSIRPSSRRRSCQNSTNPALTSLLGRL